MNKCSPRHIRTPIYMKICIGHMCWIASIYIGSHVICIGHISWTTCVLPNTYEKVLSNTHGVLPNTYTQYIFCVPNTYLGKNLRKPTYVLDNTTYVSPVSIGAQCIGQHHICIGHIYWGAPHISWETLYIYWVTLYICIGEHFLKIYVLDNNMYWVHAPNTYGGVAQYIYMYWVYILGPNVVR